jgi:hypothetical protein
MGGANYMSPQPLSRVRKTAGVNFLGAIQGQPVLAAKVKEVIGIWSHIEYVLTSMTTAFLESDYEVVSAMLNAITSADAHLIPNRSIR